MKKEKNGTIDTSALSSPPEPHEHKAAKYFSLHGLDVVFIRPSNISGVHTPDIEMAGKRWEIKSPIVYSDSSFEDNFRKAIKQSEHLIYDLRRLSEEDEEKYLKSLSRRKTSHNLKTLIVILRDNTLLTMKGKFVNIKP